MKIEQKELRSILQEIIDEVSVLADVKNILQKMISRKKDNLFINSCNGKSNCIKLNYEKIIIVGGGKVSHLIAEYFAEILEDKLTSGIIAVKSDITSKGKIKYIRSSHPKADVLSLKAANEIIRLLKTSEKKTLIIFVISGGCSALLAKPIEGILFEEKIDISDRLINSGADINEVNTFRKFFSAIKGGGILQYLNSDFISTIISDVVGNPLDTIASGLTYFSKPSNNQVSKILMKYRLYEQISNGMKNLLKTSIWENIFPDINGKNYIIFDNTDFQKIISKIAKRKNIYVHRIRKPIEGNILSAAMNLSLIYDRIINMNNQRKGLHLIISGGETTAKVHGNGVGGRNHELSLLMIDYISNFSNAVFVSLATDGDDGNSKHAGAFVSSDSQKRIHMKNLDIKLFMENNDSFSLFSILKNEVLFPRFITNVMDVQLMLVEIH